MFLIARKSTVFDPIGNALCANTHEAVMDTTDKVGELEALLAKAAPGEWSLKYGANIMAGDGYSATGLQSNFLDCTTRNAVNAELVVAAINALPELLRVYRAWQGAAVVDVVDNGGRLDRGHWIPYGAIKDDRAGVALGSHAGRSIRLLPDGQGA